MSIISLAGSMASFFINSRFLHNYMKKFLFTEGNFILLLDLNKVEDSSGYFVLFLFVDCLPTSSLFITMFLANQVV